MVAFHLISVQTALAKKQNTKEKASSSSKLCCTGILSTLNFQWKRRKPRQREATQPDYINKSHLGLNGYQQLLWSKNKSSLWKNSVTPLLHLVCVVKHSGLDAHALSGPDSLRTGTRQCGRYFALMSNK